MDTTSPILTALTITPTANSIIFEFTSDEAGTAYYLLQLGGSAPTANNEHEIIGLIEKYRNIS